MISSKKILLSALLAVGIYILCGYVLFLGLMEGYWSVSHFIGYALLGALVSVSDQSLKNGENAGKHRQTIISIIVIIGIAIVSRL